MERYNPFDDSDSSKADQGSLVAKTKGTSSLRYTEKTESINCLISPTKSQSNTLKTSRYTTSFPDPLGELKTESTSKSSPNATNSTSSARSSSVTFSHSVDEPTPSSFASLGWSARQSSGISSFLTRATSVTSSSMTDRMSEAVGNMKSAVDSLSNQIQQVVPTNFNERLSNTNNNLINSSISELQPQQQSSQSTASYLASKLSSATNQFTSSAQSTSSLHMISRQRVILIIDNPTNNSWAQHFSSYRKQTSGAGVTTTQSAFTSFFSSATASLASTSQALTASTPSLVENSDLIEQVDFRDVTILANQSTSTVTLLTSNNNTNNNQASNSKSSARIIRPEYVVVKQRTKNNIEHMSNLMTALNYSMIPMFEPIEIWSIFQNRLLVFSKLMRVQKQLGKENFPLIPQVYCQTHQDLMNYIKSSSSLPIPCLVRTGLLGKGKIKADCVQVLKTLASIVATNDVCCTLEPFLEVKCDLLIQKMGTNLKLLKRIINTQSESGSAESARGYFNSVMADTRQESQYSNVSKQAASRQTSIGSSVLSSLMSATNQQQLPRRSSNPLSPVYERSFEVNSKHRSWVEAISKEFDNKLEVFSIKLAVTTDDREYVVGLTDCTMGFVGSPENQDEDRRSFIELVLSNMNTNLSKATSTDCSNAASLPNYNTSLYGIQRCNSVENNSGTENLQRVDSPLIADKKFNSQQPVNGSSGDYSSRCSIGQMGNRSQSVSVNQPIQYGLDEQPRKKSMYLTRRVSDQGSNEVGDVMSSTLQLTSESSGLHQRQSSLSKSIFDQTSTAFSSLHKQSISLLKRFDSRASDTYNTPPHSIKSDLVFERDFQTEGGESSSSSNLAKRNGFKSRSIDSSTLLNNLGAASKSIRPPKPPPPKSMPSSTFSIGSTGKAFPDTVTKFSIQTKQNSSLSNLKDDSTIGDKHRVKVVRQNSALSAFEPFDPDLTVQKLVKEREIPTLDETVTSSTGSILAKPNKPLDPTKKNITFDSASITSGDSNSTNETTTAEDTMNNLKKTFASIFGDKCEQLNSPDELVTPSLKKHS